MFTASYNQDDVIFLLKEIDMPSTSLEEKEHSIQKGTHHYSEFVTYESAPKQEYMDLFYDSLNKNEVKFAQDVYKLAHKIYKNKPYEEIVLVSLARAGTPVGVLLKKILEQYFNKKVVHYSISIIRDKGIDVNAMKFIAQNHNSEAIAFIDGWTGKGVIGDVLTQAVLDFNQTYNTKFDHSLYVVADISGTAHHSATYEDYLLPSAILNSTISGLLSRTILNDKYVGENDYHGAVYYRNLAEHDISVWFINHVLSVVAKNIEKIVKETEETQWQNKQNITDDKKKVLHQNSIRTIQEFLAKYNMTNRNFIKPGVGESTRVLLRRIPKELWVKNKSDIVVQHLVYLAQSKNIPIIEDSNLSYNAIAVIEELD